MDGLFNLKHIIHVLDYIYGLYMFKQLNLKL